MAIRYRKNLRPVSRRINENSLRYRASKKHGTGRGEHDTHLNESSSIDDMTDNEVLSYIFDNDEGDPIPRELLIEIKRDVVKCLKANNIPIPDSLKGI